MNQTGKLSTQERRLAVLGIFLIGAVVGMGYSWIAASIVCLILLGLMRGVQYRDDAACERKGDILTAHARLLREGDSELCWRYAQHLRCMMEDGLIESSGLPLLELRDQRGALFIPHPNNLVGLFIAERARADGLSFIEALGRGEESAAKRMAQMLDDEYTRENLGQLKQVAREIVAKMNRQPQYR